MKTPTPTPREKIDAMARGIAASQLFDICDAQAAAAAAAAAADTVATAAAAAATGGTPDLEPPVEPPVFVSRDGVTAQGGHSTYTAFPQVVEVAWSASVYRYTGTL
jgi:hypothetical protein